MSRVPRRDLGGLALGGTGFRGAVKFGLRDVLQLDVPRHDLAVTELADHAIYEAVGSTRVIRTPPYPSTHNLGTNRMSAKPRDGVVNKWGQTHDIKNLFISDGSQFTTGAACNPTLTIVALVIRQADYIAQQMGQKAI